MSKERIIKKVNLKRVFLSDAGFLLIVNKVFKNGKIYGLEISDSGGIEEAEWQKDAEDIKPVKGIIIHE